MHATIIAGLLMVIGLGSFFMGENYVPDHVLVGIVCGGIAVAVIIVNRGAWSIAVALTIDEDGLWYRDWKLPVVPWRHVAKAYSTGIRLRPLLRIDLADAEVFFSGLDQNRQRQLRGNSLVKADHLLIPDGAVEMPIVKIVPIINASASRA